MVAHDGDQVANLVQRYLRDARTPGSTMRVVADDVRLGDSRDEWWWVPVVFDPDPYKRFVYYEIMSEIEEALEDKEHLNVLLVPRMIESAKCPDGI